MKTLKQASNKIMSNNCADPLTIERLELFLKPKNLLMPIPFTKSNILAQLEKDVELGIEQVFYEDFGYGYRVYNVVKMWNYILEEGLEDFDDYYYYGLSIFRKTAEKYDFKCLSEIEEEDRRLISYGT